MDAQSVHSQESFLNPETCIVHCKTLIGPSGIFVMREKSKEIQKNVNHMCKSMKCTGAEPGFFLGGGALVSCSTSTPINHIVFFFLQNSSCIRKPQVISEGGAHPLHPPPRSAPGTSRITL